MAEDFNYYYLYCKSENLVDLVFDPDFVDNLKFQYIIATILKNPFYIIAFFYHSMRILCVFLSWAIETLLFVYLKE